MRPFIFTLIAIILYSNSVSAQKGFYEKGYIIQTQDTLPGFIERLSDLEVSKVIKFKQDINSTQEKEYLPKDITAFGFVKDKVHFSSVEVEIRKDTATTSAVRFAKVLGYGSLNLYKLELPAEERLVILNYTNTHVYIIKKDNKYYTLGQYEYQRDYKVGMYKNYLGMLSVIASDCNVNKNQNNEINFTDKSMIRFLKSYNECKEPDQKLIIFINKEKSIVKRGPEIGVVKYSLKEKPNIKFSNMQNYSAGYFWDITKPRISTVVSTYVGLNLQYAKFDYSYESTEFIMENSTLTSKKVTNYNKGAFYVARIPLLFQRNIKTGANPTFFPFINGGITATFLLNNHFDTDLSISKFLTITYGAGFYIKNLKFFTTVQYTEVPLITPRNNTYINIGIGYNMKKVEK